eukprot:4090326-Ditylum_brightwellii.AAC.1
MNCGGAAMCERKQRQVWTFKGDQNERSEVFLLQTMHKEKETENYKKNVEKVSTVEGRCVDKTAKVED